MTPGYCIVVVKVPGDDSAAAEALAKVLGIKKESALPVLKSAPNVLFADMGLQQARRVAKALSSVTQKGVTLLTAEGDGGDMPKVQWPGEPVVAGKPLSSYAVSGSGPRCPACGAHIKVDMHLQEVSDTDSGGLPLPDVPQLPREAPMSPVAPHKPSGSSLDIADVERVWKERASKSGRHDGVAQKKTTGSGKPSGRKKSPSAVLNELDSGVPTLEPSATGQYDVFIGRTSNPELPAIIADLRGISLGEAKRLAAKTIIPVAKGIGKDKAIEVRQKLMVLDLKPKIVPRRKSSGEMPGARGK